MQADALLIGVAEPSDSSRFRPLLLGFPRLKIVAITSDGNHGFLHELRPRSTRIIELSAATLRAALRPPVAADAVTYVDVVLMRPPDPGNADELPPLLSDCPALRVVAIDRNCGNGFMHVLRLRSTRLADLSAAGLVAAVRRGAPQQADAHPGAAR
jgi:hypothetical protein